MEKFIIISDEYLLREDDKPFLNELLLKNHMVEVVNWHLCEINPQAKYLIRTPWDYSSYADEFKKLLENISSQATLINSFDLVLWNLDKKYLSDYYEQEKKVVPTSMISKFHVDKLKEILNKLPDDFVVKPRIGAGGEDTFKINKKVGYDTLSVLEGRDVIVQPFIPSIQTDGEFSYMFFGGKFSHAVVKNAKDGEFRIQAEHGGHVAAYDPRLEELEEVVQIYQDCEVDTAYARVDVVRYEGELVLMELEVVEPELFFRFSNHAAKMFADALSSD